MTILTGCWKGVYYMNILICDRVGQALNSHTRIKKNKTYIKPSVLSVLKHKLIDGENHLFLYIFWESRHIYDWFNNFTHNLTLHQPVITRPHLVTSMRRAISAWLYLYPQHHTIPSISTRCWTNDGLVLGQRHNIRPSLVQHLMFAG